MRDRPNEAIAARQSRSTALADAVQRVIEANVAVGQIMAVTAVARQAGCSRDFLYRHGFAGPAGLIAAANRQIADDRASQVSFTHRRTIHTLEVDLENTRAENHTLRRYVRALEQRLGEELGARDAVGPPLTRRLEQLVDDNDRLRQRVVQLEDEKSELQQRLRSMLHEANVGIAAQIQPTTRRSPRDDSRGHDAHR
jgi:cell division protein FtsB